MLGFQIYIYIERERVTIVHVSLGRIGSHGRRLRASERKKEIGDFVCGVFGEREEKGRVKNNKRNG